MLETRHEGAGLIANRFKPIRVLRQRLVHARDGRRHVAIELVPAADHDLAAMRRAIEIANSIDHPNLCRPREVLEHADQLVIVTELVEGVSIGDRLVIGPFDPLQVGALMTELLSVLARVHAAGLAHGGISPSTVMIDAAGLLRLMDLGVTRGPHRPTARLDIEAVGALAATMLAGYLGSVPAPLLAWIARCSDQVRPFADAAAAAAGLVTPDVTSTEVPRRTPLATPPRTEASVAIKIPTLDQPTTKPLELVPADIVSPNELRRGRTPSAMVKVADALALVEAVKDVAPAPPVMATPVAVAPRASGFPWLVGGLAAAVVAVAAFVWWTSQGRADLPPAVAARPLPTTGAVIAPTTPDPAPPTRPALLGAALAPDAAGVVAIDAPPRYVTPVLPQPRPLEVEFSAEAAWIETAAVYVLEEAYRQLLKYPLARVDVIGYSSSDGEEARNAQLAIGRAQAVKKYLVERGVDGARITTTAKPNAKRRHAEVRIVP